MRYPANRRDGTEEDQICGYQYRGVLLELKKGFGIPKGSKRVSGMDRYTGEIIDRYPNGQPRAFRYFLDGQKIWVWTTFYPNGKLESEGGYVQDLKSGRWKYYQVTGKLDHTEEWRDGTLIEQRKGLGLKVGIPELILPPRTYDD